MPDVADELAALILERLDVLTEINKSTFDSAHPTNCGPVQRWIEDVRQKVTRFNLKVVKAADNPGLLPPSPLFIGPRCMYCGHSVANPGDECGMCAGSEAAMDRARTAQIEALLSEVYEPEGVRIWLAATHKSGPLEGQVPNELIASGHADIVLAEAERLVGGAFA